MTSGTTMEPWLQKYVPVGCLGIPFDQKFELADQKFFSRPNDGDIPVELFLSRECQDQLLNSPSLKPFANLFRSAWIQLQIRSGVVRVYILPHDVDRGIIKRDDRSLLKAMSSLLSILNFSPEAWNGMASSSFSAITDGKKDDDDDISLLERFNNVPSPNPQPELVSDAYVREPIEWLLNSDVPGIKTPLYPNQRRSAAVMIERELDPGRMIDPRLRCRRDQSGQEWYYDSVAGLVLRQPRYYDRISGGILAEEMGTGKTLICLALIGVTKGEPTTAPDPFTVEKPTRPRIGSLVDMAAAAVNRYSKPWKQWDEYYNKHHRLNHPNPAMRKKISPGCIRALEKTDNRAFYELKRTLTEPRKSGRVTSRPTPPRKIQLSSATLIIVPNNLVGQWKDEIKKHTVGLKVVTLSDLHDEIPPVSVLIAQDIILFSQKRFEKIERERSNPEGRPFVTHCPLEHMRFKRCIIDEGHKLGNSNAQWKTDMMKCLDNLEIASRWVVTGTPSRGLYGVDQNSRLNGNGLNKKNMGQTDPTTIQERDDLTRIGNITSKFLKARPWSNTKDEPGDTPADWNIYIMQPKHHKKSSGRKDCLKATMDSLIIRHRLSDISSLLPPVEEKIIMLDGSYQDKLSLNLFSMMIIFNSVQSQRTDQDYFFHPKQARALNQIVHNLKQASFFGGVFYSVEVITKAIETAREFLDKKEIAISPEDHDLLSQAIALGEVAVKNRLKDVSNRYHAMPLLMENFPGGFAHGRHWALDGHQPLDMEEAEGKPICTEAGLVRSLQKFLNPCIDAPTSLKLMLESGRLMKQGMSEKAAILSAAQDSEDIAASSGSLAGNAVLGDDHHTMPKLSLQKLSAMEEATDSPAPPSDIEIAEPLAKTQIISTVSAKLSYLIDSIVKYQDKEQIIVFYDNENIAYYLAGVLEILQIQHLIYARSGLTAERRAQYVATFTNNQKFRVLLMDITQAAFGLDMRSASRIYFISPVLNPQVEAQAIGRARRISQSKPVSVETLVLKGSIEEVIVERRKNMSQAEHRKVKSILDDRPMYEWILNAKISPLPDAEGEVAQTAKLSVPQFVFGRGFGRELHPDEGLIMGSPEAKSKEKATEPSQVEPVRPRIPLRRGGPGGIKRSRGSSPASVDIAADAESSNNNGSSLVVERRAKKARIAFSETPPTLSESPTLWR